VLLGGIQAGIIIADKAYDADERLIAPWNQAQRGSSLRPNPTESSYALMTGIYRKRAI